MESGEGKEERSREGERWRVQSCTRTFPNYSRAIPELFLSSSEFFHQKPSQTSQNYQKSFQNRSGASLLLPPEVLRPLLWVGSVKLILFGLVPFLIKIFPSHQATNLPDAR